MLLALCFFKSLHIIVISCSQDGTRCILSCNILSSRSKHCKILQDLSKNFYSEYSIQLDGIPSAQNASNEFH